MRTLLCAALPCASSVRAGMRRLALVGWLLSGTASAAPMTVMVLYFDNHTTLREYDVLQKGMADMLITDLGQSEQLLMVEREKLDALTQELKLQHTKLFDPSTAQKLGKLAGARFAVTGAFTGFEPDVRIDVRLVDVATGKVVVSAQVKGAKDKFFELEQELVGKFLAALSAKSAGPSEGKATLGHVLGYSQGLDTADRGEVKAASAQLADVVRDAPDFQLAKTRYAALLKRLRDAGQQREAVLSDDEAELVKSIDAAIALNAGKELKGDAAERHFCYRALRSAYLQWKLERSATGPHGPLRVKVAPASAARPLLAALWENERALYAELELSPKATAAGSCPFALSGSKSRDFARARALQIPFEEASFHPATRAPPLIALLTAGLLPESPQQRVLPTFRVLDPSVAKRAHTLLDEAEALAKKRQPPGLPDHSFRLVMARAQLFLAERSTEAAITALQTWLEQNPKAKEYAQVEATIEGLLGVGAAAKKDSEAVKGCSAGHHPLLRELGRRFDTGGTKSVGGLLASTGAACSAQAHGAAAWVAAVRGDCAAAKKFAETVEDAAGIAAVCP